MKDVDLVEIKSKLNAYDNLHKKEVVSEHVSGVDLEETEEEAQKEADAEEALEVAQYKTLTSKATKEVKLMDLTKVTVIAQSGKAFLVLKEGYQKWIPYSQLYDKELEIENGQFYQNVPLTEKAEKWIHDKPWEKFKAVKNRG